MIRTLLTTTALAALLGTAVIAQDAAPAAPEDTMEAPAESTGNEMAPAEGAGNEMAPAEGTENEMAPAEGAGNEMAPAEGTEAAPAEGEGDVTPPAGQITEDIDAEVDASQDQDAAAGAEMAADEPFDVSQGYTAADSDNLVTELLGMPVYSSAGDDAEEIGNVDNLVFSEQGQIEAVIIGVGGFLGIGEKLVAADFDALQFVIAADNTERWVLETTTEALQAAPEFVWEDDAPDAMAPAVPPADPNAPAVPAAPGDPNAAPAAPAAPADPAADPAADAADPAAEPAAADPAAADPAAEQPAQ